MSPGSEWAGSDGELIPGSEIKPVAASSREDAREIESSPHAGRREVQMHVESTEVETNYVTDPETARIFAESERHAEDNRLAAFKESLVIEDAENERTHRYKDLQSERDHRFRMEQLKHSSQEKKVVLYCSLAALIAGGAISLRGDPSLGNPIMSAAMTILITLVTGKLKIGE